jgi:hypothetical protein
MLQHKAIGLGFAKPLNEDRRATISPVDVWISPEAIDRVSLGGAVDQQLAAARESISD